MTTTQGSTSMIATNRMHRPFDNNRVAFIPLDQDGTLPRIENIARHLSRQFNFPLEAGDFEAYDPNVEVGNVPHEMVLNLTGRLDGPIRIYFYGKATGCQDSQIAHYVQQAAEGLVLHGLKNETERLINRAMGMAFGIEFGTRYESPQCAHFQLHYLRTAEAQRTLEEAASYRSPWNVHLLVRDVRTGKIEHQIYTIYPRNDFGKP